LMGSYFCFSIFAVKFAAAMAAIGRNASKITRDLTIWGAAAGFSPGGVVFTSDFFFPNMAFFRG